MTEHHYLAVVGSGDDEADIETAYEVGRHVAEAGAVLVCGGLEGVMAAASRGATEGGGIAVGLLPGLDRADGNQHLTVAIPTGLGELRNGLVVRAADAVIAIGGGYGTLSEIAFALKTRVPIVSIGSWDVSEDVETVDTPAQAVRRALDLCYEREANC